MTQIEHFLTVLQALGLIALYWGAAPAVLGILYWARKRSQVRYHVGNPKVGVAVETFRTKQAAREASMRLYREHGRCFRITRTR
jgi:hypothetical protein